MIRTRYGSQVRIVARAWDWEDTGLVLVEYTDGSRLWWEADYLHADNGRREIVEASVEVLCLGKGLSNAS